MTQKRSVYTKHKTKLKSRAEKEPCLTTKFYEKSSPPSSIVFLTRNRSVVFHLSSLLSWSNWNSYHASINAFLESVTLGKTYLIGKHLLVAFLHRTCQVNEQRVFPLLLEAWIQLPVPVKRGVDTDLIACA